jgi:hypothetical protein
MATAKTAIIKAIFDQRYTADTGHLENRLVTLTDVSAAIAAFNSSNPPQQMSTRNPANFFKDFIRNRGSANRNWPESVFSAGYSARQVTSANACFEFVPVSEGQLEPFPASTFANPTHETPKHLIESVSLPLASRRLGRNDEPWLIQVIARLRIVEAHFSLVSGRSVKQLDLLQLSVKLAGTEIDALFLAQEEVSPGQFEEVIVTCEAKGGRDDILEDQILRQAKAPFSMRSITQDRVIPIAVKCVAPSTIHVVEFQEFRRESYTAVTSVEIAWDSLFEIRPPVPGICS